MNDLVKTAYQQWVALLDRIAVADPQEQLQLMPQAREAYWRCRELQGDRMPPRKGEQE